jgi:hypothetical protein
MLYYAKGNEHVILTIAEVREAWPFPLILHGFILMQVT